jgi:sialate O-acetylesterase
MKRRIFAVTLLFFNLFIASETFAKVKLPSFFTDHLVLQQQTKTGIWGWATPGKTVTVNTGWNKTNYKAAADKDGNWKVMVTTPKYGGPYEITINDGDETKVLKDILIGEVWMCSGQSNMEMPLAGWGKIINYEEEIKAADFPNIRLLHVAHQPSKLPLADVVINGGGWTVCSPATIPNFSAVAYFFAREIYQKTGIPIGLINSSWGGTVAEAWISGTTLYTNQDFAKEVDFIERSAKDEVGSTEAEKVAYWQQKTFEKDPGYKDGKFIWLAKTVDDADWKTMPMPSLWEKSVLPNFDGVVYLRTKINIPESWAGKPVKLNLGQIDDQDITYFDGEKVGESQAANVQRVYLLRADQVTAGEHTIAIRVFDTGGSGGSPSDAKLFTLSLDQETISIAGNWKYNVAFNYKDVGPSPQLSQNVNRPTLLYNGMIHPFLQYAIKGVIWYQGESNAARANQYRELFPSLITDWRKRWAIGDFPFFFVQLANFRAIEKNPVPSDWAELRDAQRGALKLANTGMAVITDIGAEKDIHPKNKQDVGKRLALIALAKTYGKKIVYSGPVFKTMKIDKNQAVLTFTSTDGGLVAKDGTLQGFTIAGSDQKFYWANAVISGGKIIVSSADVTNPVAIRYGWATNPQGNLYNGAGLPASPFKTDDWKDSTAK